MLGDSDRETVSYENLISFDSSWDLTRIEAERDALATPLSLRLTFERADERRVLKLQGLRDYDGLISLLRAEEFEFKRSIDSQKEFGNIIASYLGESDGDVYFDMFSIEETGVA